MPENPCHIAQGPPFSNKDEVFTENTPHKTAISNTVGDLKLQDKYTRLNYKLVHSFSKLQFGSVHSKPCVQHQQSKDAPCRLRVSNSNSPWALFLRRTALCYSPAQTLHTGYFPPKVY